MSCSWFWLSAVLGFRGCCWAFSFYVKVREAAACHHPCHGLRRGLANCLMRAVLQKCLSALWFVFFQGAKCSPDFGGGGEWRNLHEIFFILEKKKKQLGQTCFIGASLHFFLSLIQQWYFCSSQTWLVSKMPAVLFSLAKQWMLWVFIYEEWPCCCVFPSTAENKQLKPAAGDGFFAHGSPSACKASTSSPPG